MEREQISRRKFIEGAGLLLSVGLLYGCGSRTTAGDKGERSTITPTSIPDQSSSTGEHEIPVGWKYFRSITNPYELYHPSAWISTLDISEQGTKMDVFQNQGSGGYSTEVVIMTQPSTEWNSLEDYKATIVNDLTQQIKKGDEEISVINEGQTQIDGQDALWVTGEFPTVDTLNAKLNFINATNTIFLKDADLWHIAKISLGDRAWTYDASTKYNDLLKTVNLLS